jgi:glycosyltransferase involved in cell wall biosynthesis
MGPGPSFQKLLLLDPLLKLKVWQVAKKFEFDIIHGHSYEGFLAGLGTARIKKKKLIYDAHSTLAGELPSYGFINIRSVVDFLDKKVPEWSDHIVAVSDTLKEFLIGKGISSSKISVIPTGVNISQFEGHDPDFVRQRYNIPRDIKIVMYTGSLANFQGVDYLIEAMRIVFHERKDLVLFLVGNSNEQKYREMCSQSGIADRVVITGEKPFEEIPRFLAAADVLVSPRTECPGIPQKLSNYMAAGKAIVSFEGSAKLLTNEVDGSIVENGNTRNMGMAIIKLLKNGELRNQLGKNAKRKLVGKYDWGTLCRNVEEVYSRLLPHR